MICSDIGSRIFCAFARIFVGGQAITQLWVFLLAPTLGGAAAGVLFRFKALEAE